MTNLLHFEVAKAYPEIRANLEHPVWMTDQAGMLPYVVPMIRPKQNVPPL